MSSDLCSHIPVPPFPASATAEGAQLNVPPFLWERVLSQGESLHPHTSACLIHDLGCNLRIALLTGKFFDTPAHHSAYKAWGTLQALLGFHRPTQVTLCRVKGVLD